MAQGAMIKNGVVYDIVDAASDINEAYGKDGDDVIAFVPSETAKIGDTWDSKLGFTSAAVAPVSGSPTAEKIQAALLEFGLSQSAVDKVMAIAIGK